MSNYIDLKFINELSSRLELFKKKGDYLFNFRCPHCGDSKKNKTKARAYLYRKKNDMFFKCHNCGMGQSLGNFIKFIDVKSFERYTLERYKGSTPSSPKPDFGQFVPKFSQQEVSFLDDLKKVSDLPEEHPVRQYVINRKIPEKYFDILYLADKFMAFVNKHKPKTFPHTKYDHPRLIIPFYDSTGEEFAFQGRAFGDEQPKYLTIKLNEDKKKIYGLERLNLQDHVYILEGPIDSLFIDNAIAAAGADLFIDRLSPKDVTYIFDNEPRNKEIVKRMYDVIEKDYNIMIWPEHIHAKDVNDLAVSGLGEKEIKEIISNNTFSKLEAVTRMSIYKKC